MVWLYIVLAIIAIVFIWLAFEVLKWLFIVAVVIALIWAALAVRHRLAR